MLKNIQIKIILMFMLVGIVIIGILGYCSMQQLNNVYVNTNDFQLQELVKQELNTTKELVIYSSLFFIGIAIIIGLFATRFIMRPILSLIKNAEKVVAGEDIDIKFLSDGKSKNEIDNLVEAFSIMNAELKEKLNETARQKRQIETILLHMTDGIIAFNIDGQILHINHAAKILLNINEEKTFDEIFAELNLEINMEKIIYLENWTSYDQRLTVGEKYLNMLFAPFKDEAKRPEGIILVIQDITEHVKLNNMRKEFVADVSHELKTPITSIIGYSETLQEAEYDKETQDKFLSVIVSQAKMMSKLVNDLLTLSKYDNDQIKTEKSEFDLGELVKGVYENLRLESKKKNQSLQCLVTASVPPVYANRDGIERVIINILSNSIKYTPEKGTIKIYVGFVYNDAYIKIIDNGIGIPEEDLERIFDRFYRVDKARSREMGGTGLGLSIAKEILEKNDGSIDIKSELGKGTEVVIRIPAVTERKSKNGENKY